MNNVRRIENTESYAQFAFDGEFAKMRTTAMIKPVDMTKNDALDRIANLLAGGWVEVDPC